MGSKIISSPLRRAALGLTGVVLPLAKEPLQKLPGAAIMI
jgi:hypothetical protein